MSPESLEPFGVAAPGRDTRVSRRFARASRSLAGLAGLIGLALIGSALAASPESKSHAPVPTPTAGPSAAATSSAEAAPEAAEGDGQLDAAFDYGDDISQVGEGSLLARGAQSKRFEGLPLEHTDVQIDVRGLVSTATVTQRFCNPGTRPIEAVYVFPLPHDAAVYDMEARIGTRVIKSVIKERDAARRVYEQARDNGQRAALVEQERPNIFTTSLANILPGERVEVRLRYVNVLPWEDGRARLTFPLVVGPRYIPGTRPRDDDGPADTPGTDPVPDAARITPPVRARSQRSGHDVSLRVRLETGLPLGRVQSPSHAIVAQAEANGVWRVDLQAGATWPNRDFVVEFTRAPERSARAAVFVSATQPGADAHFLLTAYPPALEPTGERQPLELIFIVDVSGSMSGTSIEQARAALRQGLDRLNARDRFQIVAYSDDYRLFRSEPVAASTLNIAAAKLWSYGLRADGGTELLPALQAVLKMHANGERLRQIVLLTDGCLGNEDQLFASLRAGLGEARLYAVAIGSAPNHHLATKMAEYGRGTFKAITDGSEVQAQMGRLLDQITSPVLTDLHLTWQGVKVEDVLPRRLPDLYQGQPVLLYGRLGPGSDGGTLVLEGRANQAPFRQELSVDTTQADFHPGISTLWARARVEEWMDTWRAASADADREAARDAIVELALQHRLVTKFTSLVAIEEQPAHGEGAPDKVAVATELPAGWQLDVANPATGTADLFFETLALALLAAGTLLLAVRVLMGGQS